MTNTSAGKRFGLHSKPTTLFRSWAPLTPTAPFAEKAGHQAIYLSGGDSQRVVWTA